MSEKIDGRPELNKKRFICPKCDAYAAQNWYELQYSSTLSGAFYSFPLDDENSAGTRGGPRSKSRWSFCVCASCEKGSMWRGEQMIYPQASFAPIPSEDMPDDVKSLYVEAGAVAAVSPRAGAAMARATLERLLKELLPDHSASARLDDLIAMAESQVSAHTWKLMTLLRFTGNTSIHVQGVPEESTVFFLLDEDPGVLNVLFGTINDVVDELITKPRQADQLYQKVPQEVRDRAEQKAKNNSY